MSDQIHLQRTVDPDEPIDEVPPSDMTANEVRAWRELLRVGGDTLRESDCIAVEAAAILLSRVRSGDSDAGPGLAALLAELQVTPASREGEL